MVKIPDSSFLIPTVNLFTADYNTPTPGYYDWGVAANTNQEIFGISPGFLYYMAIMNFGATVPEGDFLANVSTIPKIQFGTSLTGRSLFGGGYPIANYLKNNEISAFLWTAQKEDTLIGTFTGVLSQNAALAGVASITAHVSLNLFQIVDKDFTNKFFGVTKANQNAAGAIQVGPEWDKRL